LRGPERPPTRRSTARPDSSPGVHRSPLRRHNRHCVHFPSGPSPRLRLGTAKSRACSVPAVPPGFNGFLRSRADPKTHSFDGLRVCCTPQPAMGFTKFQTPCSTSRKSPTRRSWTRRSAGSHPLWRLPYEAFPSSAAFDHAVTASRPFGRDRVHRLVCLLAVRALPATVSPRRAALLVDLKALLHRGVRCLRATLPLRARSMLPWALDRTRSDAAARFAPPSLAGRFAWRSEPLRRPPTRTSREGRVFRPCLASCGRRRCDPRGESRA